MDKPKVTIGARREEPPATIDDAEPNERNELDGERSELASALHFETVEEGKRWRVKDDRGRRIEFRRLTALDKMRITLVFGDQMSDRLIQYVFPAWSTQSIDGDAIMPPRNQVQLEGTVARLDDDGLGAVLIGWGLAGLVGRTEDRRRADVKNSPGTPTS